MKEYDIFISYRREGGKEYARNLTLELVSRGYHPFLDFDELKDGKFDKRITDAIESAPVFLFILSRGSLDRCVNEGDWVRKEIMHAIEHKRHIVPVDIDKQFVGFPSSKDFPKEIKESLGQQQFSQIQTEMLYKVSIDELVRNRIQPAIEKYRRERQRAAGMTGAEIHIETDTDCHVQRFHKDMIVAKVDVENVIRLPKGKHKLQFISVYNSEVRDSIEYKVSDISDSDYIEVSLKEKNYSKLDESTELETLLRDKNELVKKNQELQQKLNIANSNLQQLTEHSESIENKLKAEIENLSKEVKKVKEELSVKDQTIVSLEKKLEEAHVNFEKVHSEVESRKDTKIQSCTSEDDKQKSEISKPVCYQIGNVQFKMIYVEGGVFYMGATSEVQAPYSWEFPVHQVEVSSYYIGETLVTQSLWKEVMGNNPSYFDGAQNPVEQISWDDCIEFIKKLNNKTGRNFCLLTEAQWEFAARGGKKCVQNTQYSGSNKLEEVAWFETNSGNKTHPIKKKKPNELGIYDMTGNVWEWCSDLYGSYSSEGQVNPIGPESGTYHVFRGGSWCSKAKYCRLSYRDCNSTDYSSSDLGFRLALPIK